MSKGSAIFIIVLIGIILIAALSGIYFNYTPAGKATWNSWFYSIQKADDSTAYTTRKNVEDTCRAMIASYNSDKLTYEQYKDSADKDEHSWADQAKMRANKTASSYNNYILQNTFVWKGNVPSDIQDSLSYIT